MVRASLLILGLALAGSAAAQTTTNCHTMLANTKFPYTICDTSAPPPPVPDMSSGPAPAVDWRSVLPRRCNPVEIVAYMGSNECEAREVAANRKAVGDLIAGGRCDEAIRAALGTGDLQYATEVRTYCAGSR